MKIRADASICQGHALCAGVDEELFPLDDQGYSALTTWAEVPTGQEGTARLGRDSCPERAIVIED